MLIDDRLYYTPKWTKSLGKGISSDMLTILNSINDYDLIDRYSWEKGCVETYRLSSLNGDDIEARATVNVSFGCISVELSVFGDGDSPNHYAEWDRYDQPTTWESVFFGMLDDSGCFVDEG